MNQNLDTLLDLLPLNEPEGMKVIVTITVLLLLWATNRFVGLVISRNVEEPTLQYSWKKISFYVSTIIALILIGRTWLQGFQALITFLSIVAAALTITQKESLMNLVGSLLILWRDLFVVGDRIEVGGLRGDVVGFGVFYFSIMEIAGLDSGEQSTGRIVKIPNGMVLNNPVANYTKSFPYIWHEFKLTITPESDWETAKQILLDSATQHTTSIQEEASQAIKRIPKDEIIILGQLSPIVYLTQKNDNPTGLILQLRFLCPPKKRRDLQQVIFEEALKAFSQHDDIQLVS